jgi:hypothetical protein
MDTGVPPSAHRAAIVIGWREPVSLPQWRIRRLRTKIDTGARTSALHVSSIEPLGDGRVRFEAVVSCRRESGRVVLRSVPLESQIIRTATVRSSTGRTQRRYVVRATARIGPVERDIELTLVCRRRMRCRLLVGRSALHGFIVDPHRPRVLTPWRTQRRAGA